MLRWSNPVRYAAVLSLLTAGISLAAEVPAGQSVIPNEVSAFQLVGEQVSLGKMSIIDVTGEPFTQALKLSTQSGAKNEWNVQASIPVTGAIKKGDVLFAHFWMRCNESITGEALVAFEFELAHPDYAKAVELRIGAGLTWKEVFVPFKAPQDYAANDAHAAFRLGFDRQIVEVGGVELKNLGPNVDIDSLPKTKISYVGREPDAQWRKDALARIEKIRKNDMTVAVVDGAGKPVSNADVHVKLTRHQFGFGAAVDAIPINGTSPDDKKYQEVLARDFNQATFGNEMKWYATWGGIPASTDQATQWLIDHNFTIRGHNLTWPSWKWMPQQLQAFSNDPAKLNQLTDAHIEEIMSHYKGKCFQWDVVNEVYANHDFLDVVGGKDVMLHWFDMAHKLDPDSTLFINDYGILDGGARSDHREGYFNEIKYLLDHKAPLGGIGIQSHFGTEMPALTQVLSVLDRFGEFGLPIESTEFSLNSTDRQLEADYARDYMIAVFSHPAVKGFTAWGFAIKYHWRPEGAFFDEHWNIRPIGQAYEDLVLKQWQTDVTVKTDAEGKANVRGFLGQYQIKATDGSKKADAATTLSAGQPPVVKITLP